MRVLIQRVRESAVTVDGETVGAIGPGLTVFVGVGPDDGEAEAAMLARKTAELRIFEDAEGKTNLAITEAGGAVLVISQFTLYGGLPQGPPTELYSRRVARAGRTARRPLCRSAARAWPHRC